MENREKENNKHPTAPAKFRIEVASNVNRNQFAILSLTLN